MTDEQRKLVSRFRALPEYRQRALEILSAAYFPRSRTDALGLVNAERAMHSPTGTQLAFSDWKLLVADLLSNGLLVEVKNHIQCNPLIKETMMWHAARSGRLTRLMAVTAGLRTDYRYNLLRNSFRSKPLILFRQIRESLHLNEETEFLAHWEQWFGLTAHELEGFDIVRELCSNPFDPEWMHSRSPRIRDIVLPRLISPLLDSLDSAVVEIGVAERVVQGGAGSGELAELIAEYLLLAGDVVGAERHLAGVSSWKAKALRGWAACISERKDDAVRLFEAALKLNRKQTRRRLVVLPPRIGGIYVFSLIGSTLRNRLAKAHKYLDLAIRKCPEAENPLYRALKGAVCFAEGRADAARKLATTVGSTASVPGAARVLAHAALCAVAPESARKAHQELGDVPSNASQNGYGWVALEIMRIRNDMIEKPRNEVHSKYSELARSCRPLLNQFSEQPAWQRTLDALARVSEAGAVGSGAQGQRSRLVWRISLGGAIAPYHQVLTKRGTWTKGRSVALKRLHDQDYNGHLTPADQRICSAIAAYSSGNYYGGAEYSLDHDRALRELVGHPCVFRSDDPSAKVEVVNAEPCLSIVTKRRNVRLQVVPKAPKEGSTAIRFESPSRLAVSVFRPRHHRILEVIGRDGLTVPIAAKASIVRAISGVSKLVTVHSDIDAGQAESVEVPADAALRFNMTPYGHGLRIEPRVAPLKEGGPSFRPGKGGKAVFATVNGRAVHTARDLGEERRRFGTAVSACPSLGEGSWDGSGWILDSPASCLELLDELHQIRDEVILAWPQGESMRIRARATFKSLSLKIRSARDWFQVSGSVETDEGLVLDLQQILASVQGANGRFVPLGDSGFIALTSRFHRAIQELAAFAVREGKDLRFHRARAHLLEAVADHAGSLDAGTRWKRQVRRLTAAQALDPPVPSTLRAQLRDYQVKGFRWAMRLAAWGGGACLADDMGLGKTVQALAVFLDRAKGGPALVVAPTSVCPNWMDEARRFAPTLNALPFGRGDRKAMLQGLSAFDLVIASYGLLRQAQDLLASVKWETVVLDEAQAIKNRETQVSKAAMRLSSGFRMITTGTPVENHIGELWNLFRFLNPGLLGSADWFNSEFAVPIHQRGSLTKRAQLKRLIRPFVLRRTKSAVLDELPPRTEITLRIQMSTKERALYEAVRRQALESLNEGNGAAGPGHIRVLAEIMKLRRACCHPHLVLPDSQVASSKLSKFLETVAELKDSAHKALVFSQFVGHFAIVRTHLDRLGISYRYLDGSTPAGKRKKEVERFQNGDGDLFLISLRAGGHGLNLTAADYVIHLDPWWNPAVEDQASDRAHRIGQTRPVTIYRLVMRDTIEESILDLHRSKRDLADSLLEGTDISGKLSAEELVALIQEG